MACASEPPLTRTFDAFTLERRPQHPWSNRRLSRMSDHTLPAVKDAVKELTSVPGAQHGRSSDSGLFRMCPARSEGFEPPTF
jgi:hypothetical protein